MNKDITESANINPGTRNIYIVIRNCGLITLFKKMTGIQKLL
jgi:hypothetical protein